MHVHVLSQIIFAVLSLLIFAYIVFIKKINISEPRLAIYVLFGICALLTTYMFFLIYSNPVLWVIRTGEPF